MIRVALVDDHVTVRLGLQRLLAGDHEIEVVGTATDGSEAVDLVTAERPDVVLMDLQMPVLDGVEATRQIRHLLPHVRIVILTSFSDRDRIVAALDAGAIGYLLKDIEPEALLAGVRAAARGESPRPRDGHAID
jgi:DNA-binding NarL/FixJ family response regulator